MYQPQPVGGQPPIPSQPPQSVLTAVKLMYVGAALEIVGLVLNLVTIGTTHNVSQGVIGPLIGAALWLWLAAMNKQGKNWARITGTVLFGLDCIVVLLFLVGLGVLLSLVAAAGGGIATIVVILTAVAIILTWLLGLFIVIMLWKKESSAYFQAMSGR